MTSVTAPALPLGLCPRGARAQQHQRLRRLGRDLQPRGQQEAKPRQSPRPWPTASVGPDLSPLHFLQGTPAR